MLTLSALTQFFFVCSGFDRPERSVDLRITLQGGSSSRPIFKFLSLSLEVLSYLLPLLKEGQTNPALERLRPLGCSNRILDDVIFDLISRASIQLAF